MLRNSREVLLIVCVLMAPLAKGDQVIFSDNFDAEPTGYSRTTLLNWRVANFGGSVDVLSHGTWGLICVGNAGRCVDLDGTTSAAAELISKTLTLPAGTYTLNYQLAGSQRGDTNRVNILFGETLLRTVTLVSSRPYTTFSDVINVSASQSGSIKFHHSGGDRNGLALDNVVLTKKINIPSVVRGDASWARPPYDVQCKNNTTSKTVIKRNLASSYDCEKWGLIVHPGDNVTVNITGVKK